MKSLGNTDINGTRKNVRDVVVFGDGDMFKLMCKASSEEQGWVNNSPLKGSSFEAGGFEALSLAYKEYV